MTDRRDITRYLRQLRELGEDELVLQHLTRAELASLHSGSAASEAHRGAGAQRTARATEADADWRAVLTAAGASPEGGKRGARSEPAEPAGTPAPAPGAGGRRYAFAQPADAGATVPVADRGIVVADTGVDMFAELANLNTLAEIAASVSACSRCGLHRSAQNPVPGEGSPTADLVCVGEAPGASEDETGRPFVGAAGQLLTSILAAINLKREEVFICNVLKHRPPGNRNPAPDEVTACRPFLVRQLDLLKPRVILALGTFAAQTLLETKTSLGKLRGFVHSYRGIPVVVTYHPAALLRNPSWKRPTWEDVQLARRILDGER